MTENHAATDATAILSGARAIGVSLEPTAAERLARYLAAMLAANERVNLTAVRDPAAAVMLHAVDSLAIALAMPEAPKTVFDLGTGNGFPGVACAVLWPDARVVLCDRTQKKLTAIAACLEIAGIAAETLWADADQLPAQRRDLRRSFELVCARAVGEAPSVARSAYPLLARRARLALWTTADERPPVKLAGGMSREQHVRYELGEHAARARAISIWRCD